MCDPVSVGVGVASLAASGLSAYSQVQAGRYNAAVAQQNAAADTAAANDSINRGNQQAQQQRDQARAAGGSQAAAMAANGMDLNSGTALNFFGDTSRQGALDSLTSINNAQREAYGYQMQANNATSQAQMARYQGRMGAFTTLLTAPLNAYGAYRMAGGKNLFEQSATKTATQAGKGPWDDYYRYNMFG